MQNKIYKKLRTDKFLEYYSASCFVLGGLLVCKLFQEGHGQAFWKNEELEIA